jgi:hypothetical protein
MSMKKLRKAAVVLLAFVATPLLAQNYQVESDKDLSAPFNTYKTYAWAQQVRTAESLAYAINDAMLKAKLQEAVGHELAARDMKEVAQSPDLLVNYRVFDKPVEMTGYEGYFRDTNYWGTNEVRNNNLGLIPRANSTGGPADRGTQYYFDKGTLMIQLVDANKGVVVWQGYASGLMDGDNFDKDMDHVNKAVKLIFDRYNEVLTR